MRSASAWMMIFVVSSAVTAAAEPILPAGTYVRAFGGGDDQVFDGPVGGVALGFEGQAGRVELEASTRTYSLSPGTADRAGTVMLNGYLPVANQEGRGPVTPYVGAGIGLASGLDSGAGSDNTALAGQIMAGVEYELNNDVSLTGEVRFFTTEEFTSTIGGAPEETRVEGVDALVGLILRF